MMFSPPHTPMRHPVHQPANHIHKRRKWDVYDLHIDEGVSATSNQIYIESEEPHWEIRKLWVQSTQSSPVLVFAKLVAMHWLSSSHSWHVFIYCQSSSGILLSCLTRFYCESIKHGSHARKQRHLCTWSRYKCSVFFLLHHSDSTPSLSHITHVILLMYNPQPSTCSQMLDNRDVGTPLPPLTPPLKESNEHHLFRRSLRLPAESIRLVNLLDPQIIQ